MGDETGIEWKRWLRGWILCWYYYGWGPAIARDSNGRAYMVMINLGPICMFWIEPVSKDHKEVPGE